MGRQAAEESNRLIGKIEKDSGPVMILVGGIHGNEPAGIQACNEILLQLSYLENKFRGSIYAIRGNIQALEKKLRYIDTDLNRMWRTDVDVTAYKETAEYREFESINRILKDIRSSIGGRQLIVLDLHTTSSESLPFLLSTNQPHNRRLVKPIPVPTVFGVENRIKGTLINHINETGGSGIVFEAGQHEDPFSVMYHKSLILMLLVGSGILNQSDIEGFEDMVNNLYQHSRSMQYVFEIMFRYGIRKGEEFRMEPGFRNFMEIEQGQVLAHNEYGQIVSPLPGRIFMPLYQSQGDDGFFIIDEIL